MTYLPAFLQLSSRQVWFQAIGRLLYQTGYGLIQFYIPLVFVKQVGLSATAVGIGIGSGSLAGFVGHFLGGYLADSRFGRKKTLLIAAALSILAAVVLVLTRNLPLLVFANLIMGLSAGCYWTAADASVIDVTTPEQRHNAFGVLVLADSLGSGLGVLSGSRLLALFNRIEALFICSGILFVVFLILAQIAITETRQRNLEDSNALQGFVVAFKDRALQLFVVANILFTTYIALVGSTLPLYFTNVGTLAGSSLTSIANLYTWCYVGLGAILQLPLLQIFGTLPRIQVLSVSMLLWGVGFLSVWFVEISSSFQLALMITAFSLLSVATISYKPFAPAIVAEFAPESLRGIYLAISYQCWSVGYFIGPIVGGWAIDRSRNFLAHELWLIVALTTLSGILVLYLFNQSKLTRALVYSEQTTTQQT